ncbi:MAG: tetratricopeptide repeat protein [Candidatus Levyibacteriota bacterium]
MSTLLKQLAINSALCNDWKQAEELNLQLIQENPNDIDSLNRLGFALMKLGKYNKARDMYKKVIAMDKTNPIAVKNLKRLETVSQTDHQNGNGNSMPSVSLTGIFIEEAGKTKTVELKNIADKKMLSLIEPGDPVSMVIKRSKIFVQSMDKKYIGMLPDNISMRLISFMKGGNEYSSCVKACDEKMVTVFIKETKKSGRFKNQASFISTSSSISDQE